MTEDEGGLGAGDGPASRSGLESASAGNSCWQVSVEFLGCFVCHPDGLVVAELAAQDLVPIRALDVWIAFGVLDRGEVVVGDVGMVEYVLFAVVLDGLPDE